MVSLCAGGFARIFSFLSSFPSSFLSFFVVVVVVNAKQTKENYSCVLDSPELVNSLPLAGFRSGRGGGNPTSMLGRIFLADRGKHCRKRVGTSFRGTHLIGFLFCLFIPGRVKKGGRQARERTSRERQRGERERREKPRRRNESKNRLDQTKRRKGFVVW